MVDSELDFSDIQTLNNDDEIYELQIIVYKYVIYFTGI